MSTEQINYYQIMKINQLLRKLNKLKKNVKSNPSIDLNLIKKFKDFNNDIDLLKDDIDYLNIKLSVNKISSTDQSKITLYNHYNDLSSKYFCLILYYSLFTNNNNNYEYIECEQCKLRFEGSKYLEEYSNHLKNYHKKKN